MTSVAVASNELTLKQKGSQLPLDQSSHEGAQSK